MKEEKIAVFAGSFDPITNGHIDILSRACKIFDKVYLALSINPKKKDRFSKEERILMAEESIKFIPNALVGVNDGYTVDFARKVGARFLVRGIRNENDLRFEKELSEANKKLAPEIETVFLFASESLISLSSTEVERMAKEGEDISPFVPFPVVEAYKKRKW